MTLGEWHLEHDWRSPRDPKHDYAGNLTRGDIDDINDWLENGSS